MAKAKPKPPTALAGTYKAIQSGKFDAAEPGALGKALALKRLGFVTRERGKDGETWQAS